MERKDMVFMIFAVLALTIFAVLLAGCETQQVPGTTQHGTNTVGTPVTQLGSFAQDKVFEPKKDVKTLSFASNDEVLNFIKSNSGGTNSYYYGGVRGGAMMEKAFTSSVAMDSAGSAPSAAPTMVNAEEGDFSTTNNQVNGVDEADIIKTDGDYIYTTSGNTLYIVKAYPGEDAKIISTVKFENTPQGVFINGKYMAVFGYFSDIDFFKKMDFKPRQGMTFFNIYDISDKEKPVLVKEYKFEGSYFQSRMAKGYVYFVTNTMPEVRRDYPTPIMMEGTTVKSVAPQDVFYFDIPYSSVQFSTVHAINLNDISDAVNSKTVAVESSQNMYMSEANIYITYTEYINEWEMRNKIMIDLLEDNLTEADKLLVEKIKLTDNEVLSQAEKESKILSIMYSYINFMTSDEQQDFNDRVEELLKAKLDEYEYMEFTVINKVSVDNGEIEVMANGKVPGHLNNQFSMDENEGVLRIATTISQRWSYYKGENTETQSMNNVFTLDSNLKLMDSLLGLAKGESIQSTRFMGDRLYMVTFRQVDPFFVIDLSNPKKITELGKLKIPGFSRYLHPYDENTIIGIGRDASAVTGETRGLKISIFDVSDVSAPKEKAKFVTSEKYAQSAAEYEHKAFLFSKEKGILVIPAYSMTYRDCWGINCPTYSPSEDYNGAMVFKISANSIEMRGIIDHSLGTNKGQYYGPLVERSLYIKDLLYTKSQGLLRINKIDDLSKVKNIEFTGERSPYPVY